MGPLRTPGASGVLIVSASAGSGHVSAGRALECAFRELSSGVHVQHVDILDLTSPVVRRAYGGGFELVASRAPWLWRQMYERTDGRIDRARWGGPAERVLFRPFRRLLESRRWAAVVSTHFLPPQLAAGGTVPFALVVTDFTLHRYWAQPRVGRYFVATEGLAGELRDRVPGARIDASGIPVRDIFRTVPSREAARRSLELEPSLPVVLVMGGGMGVGVEESAEALLRGGQTVQVLALCGRNEAARSRLRGASTASGPGRLHVLGRVDDVATLMAAADIVVTKPGGLTVSEALAVARPLVMAGAFPGQEEGNARAAESAGAGVYAGCPAGVARVVSRLLGDRDRLRSMERAARQVGRPDSAMTVASAILREFALSRVA